MTTHPATDSIALSRSTHPGNAPEASPDGGASAVPEAERAARPTPPAPPPGTALPPAPRWALLLAYALLGWVLCIVIAGGTVRLTGSGMSIPDWPIIYYGPDATRGSILPPFGQDAWQTVHTTYHAEYLHKLDPPRNVAMPRFKIEFYIEYAHRALVKMFGLPYLALLGASLVLPALRRRIRGVMIASGAVLFTQIVLGGEVVLNHTPPPLVAIHLTTAFIFSALLVWAALRLARDGEERAPAPPLVTRWVWALLIIAVIQVYTGGVMAKTDAARLQHLATWPKMGTQWIPANALWLDTIQPAIYNFFENEVLVQFTHRWWALAVAIASVAVIIRLFRSPLSPAGRWTLRGLAFVLVAQILVGILTLLHMVPLSLGLLHLGTGFVFFLLIVALLYEVRTNNAIYQMEQRAITKAEQALEAQMA